MQSRLSKIIRFPYTDLHNRIAIYGRYAKQLKSEELKWLAEQSNSLTGRDIKNICEDAKGSGLHNC